MRETRNERVKEKHRRKQQSRYLLFAAVAAVVVLIAGIAWIGQPVPEKNDAAETGIPVSSTEPVSNQGAVQQNTNEPIEQNTVTIPLVSEEESWKVMLVNSSHGLQDGYVPELTTVDHTSFRFDVRAADDLNAMLQAARAEGLAPMICSSYRSWERQNTLFEKQVVKQQNTGLSYEAAYEKAKTVVAFPGTSEHQTGLAADIVATSHQVLDDSQEQTAEQQWLMEHCWEYGFILRYPKDKSDITGIIYEPWHYRYVGHEIAQYIHENGLCLEEYWQQVEEQQARLTQQEAI